MTAENNRLGRRHGNGALLRLFLLIPLLLCSTFVFSQINDEDNDFDAESAESAGIADSTLQDTLPVKEVDIRTEWFDLGRWKRGKAPRIEQGADLRELIYFDRIERLDGFYANLGQIATPYKRYRYGLDASFLKTGLSLNPFTGQEDVYLLDPLKDVQFFDTRTPYINLYYGQGKSDMSSLEVDVSQNITPWWNISFLFRRDKTEGTYSEFAANHLDLYVASNYRSRNGRYQLFGSVMFQEHNNAINGGVAQRFDFEDLFGGGTQPVALSGASLEQINRAFAFQHMYQFVRDTVKSPHRLVVYNEIQRDFFENEYTDTIIDPLVFTDPYPLYPTLFTGIDFVYERFQHRRWTGKAGATYRFTKPAFQSSHHLYLTNELTNFDKKRVERNLNRFTTSYEGELAISPAPFELKGELDMDLTTSNLFPTSTYTEGRASFSFPKEVVDYSYWKELEKRVDQEKPDSVLMKGKRRLFTAFASALLYDRNPTIQQGFGDGWWGNGFRGNPNLDNQRIELFKAGIQLNGKERKTEYGVMQGHHFSLTGFRSRQYAMIYMDTAMVLNQAPRDSYLEFFGFEVEGRLKMGSFYLDGRTTYQFPTSSGSDFLESYLRLNQPYLYGKVGLYWEKHDLKIARAIRAGIELWYHVDYDEQLFDGPTQQFYPQNTFVMGGNQRLDAFFSAQVKKAQLFLRVYNSLEGVSAPGYMPTLFYPLWDRNLMVGVNWSFFD